MASGAGTDIRRLRLYGLAARRAVARLAITAVWPPQIQNRKTRNLTLSAKRFRDWAPTVCRRPVSGTVSLPLSGCFSPFPHGTGSLSVSKEYLAFEGGPPIFRQDFTCPALLNTCLNASCTGLSPISPSFPTGSTHVSTSAGPRSLATTNGVSVDFLSYGY